MSLTNLRIQNVRNIKEANLEFGPQFNIFYGENGSGKTSLLEAVYLLSTGKSFRTSNIPKVIQNSTDYLLLFGKLDSKKNQNIGLRKTNDKLSEIHINGEKVNKLSELAQCLPTLVVTQDSHKLLESGPQWRREFLDWGLFHVKHDFGETWSNYRKILKQRNMALSSHASKKEIDAWNFNLAATGSKITSHRKEYISQLIPHFQKYSGSLLGEGEFQLKYKQGWPQDLDLLESLSSQYERDIITGRTEYGPHRADLTVLFNGKDSKDHVSRGQQKLLVYSLKLGQIALMNEMSNKDTLMLLDDLGSELDVIHASKLIVLLANYFTQVFITTANLETLPLNEVVNKKMFHVKHGTIESLN